MFRPAILAFAMLLFFLYLATAEGRPLPPEPPEYEQTWLSIEQRERFYALLLQAQTSPAAWRRAQKYRDQAVFFGRQSYDLKTIFNLVFPNQRDQIQLHDDGARTGKIVFEGTGVEGHMQIVFDPLSMYIRIRRQNVFREWVYYTWQKGQIRNICRQNGGFSRASHIKVKL